MCDKGIGFVRIDGRTPAQDRQLAVHSFRSLKEVSAHPHNFVEFFKLLP